MANWKENPFAWWMRGLAFMSWADAMELETTEGPAEFAWVDIETTGLVEGKDHVLQLGIVLTDGVGRIIRDGVIDILIYNLDDNRWSEAISNMIPLVREMHEKSGLTKSLSNALMHPSRDRLHPAQVAYDAREWLTMMCGPEVQLQLSGSTPHFDRGFIKEDLPALNDWFHYRSGVDVSSLREVAKRINPSVVENQPDAMKVHLPIPDLVDSIRLYRYLLTSFLVMDDATKEKF